MLKFLLSSCLLFANIAFANSVFFEIFDEKDNQEVVGIITANGKTIITTKYQHIIQNNDDIDGNKDRNGLVFMKMTTKNILTTTH